MIWCAEESYLHLDDNALCFADEKSYDDDNSKVGGSSATEDDGEENSKPMVTLAAARCSVQLLQVLCQARLQ